MVKNTKVENNFINLVDRMRILANKDVNEICDELRNNKPFNDGLDCMLKTFKGLLKSDSQNKDIRLFANNHHLILEHEDIVNNLEFDCDYDLDGYSVVSHFGGYDVVEIKNITVSDIPQNINKKMNLSLNKRIQIEKNNFSTIVKDKLFEGKWGSNPKYEPTKDDICSFISKKIKRKLSVFYILMKNGNFYFKREVELFVDNEGKLGNVYSSITPNNTRFSEITLILSIRSSDFIKRAYINMLNDRYGNSFDEFLIYYSKKIKKEAEEYLNKLLIDGNQFNLSDIQSGQYGLAILDDLRLENDISELREIKYLKSLIAHEKDPKQRKRFGHIVLKLLEE